MKVFISHKQEDALQASRISLFLRMQDIDTYLDVMDSSITGNGQELTNHIKKALNDCTDILVVMSETTRYSQWVPFEIGMSAQANMPTVTFLQADVKLPDFLSYWPRLRKLDDLSKYIRSRSETRSQMMQKYGSAYSFSERRTVEETEVFYRNLRSSLRY